MICYFSAYAQWRWASIASTSLRSWADSYPNSSSSKGGGAVDTTRFELRARYTPLISTSIISYMDSCFSSRLSILITFYIFGLLDLDFFRKEGFVGETLLFLDGLVSSGRFCGGFTSPFLSYYYYFSSLFTSLSPPPLGDWDVVSSDVLCISYTSYFFFFFLLLGKSYSSWVTTEFLMRYDSVISTRSAGIRSFAGYSLMISSRSSVVSL